MSERDLPSNLDYEAAVISSCFQSPAAVEGARDLLTADDFVSESHRHIFAAIGSLATRGVRIDPFAVSTELERAGTLRAAGGKEYIGDVMDVVPTAVNLEHYATVLREKTAQRRVIVAAQAAIEAAHSGMDFPAIDADLEHALAVVRSRGAGDRVFDDKHAMAEGAFAFLRGEQSSGLPYGFAPLDRALLPIRVGHFVLVGGASGSGKSTVVRNFVHAWVQRYEEQVGMLSLEMPGQEQIEAMAFIDANVSAERYYRQQLYEHERMRLWNAIESWRDCAAFRINEQGAVTPEQALRMMRRWHSEGVRVFVIDHLHRLDYGASREGELRVPMANFARALKSFAKDFECRVIALVQYSKIKPHEEPDDSKIREANNILEESDGVLHIYRPLVACERTLQGIVVPLTKQDGTGRYFENDDKAPHGCFYAHDPEYVYVKLGKQRRRIRDGLIRIPFNADTWALYDTKRDA